MLSDFLAALRGKLSHDDLSVYNAVQKLLYAGVLLAGVVIVLSGLSIWKPVQFWWLTAFFGGYNTARYVHFAAMTAIVTFLTVHVVLAIIVPKSLRAMIIRPLSFVEETMSRQRKQIPGVDPKLLIKDAAKLLPEPSRRLFLRGAASLGAVAMLTGCDIVDGPTSENALRVISRFQRLGPGAPVQSKHAGARISGKRDYAAVSVQRLLHRRRGAGRRRRQIQA